MVGPYFPPLSQRPHGCCRNVFVLLVEKMPSHLMWWLPFLYCLIVLSLYVMFFEVQLAASITFISESRCESEFLFDEVCFAAGAVLHGLVRILRDIQKWHTACQGELWLLLAFGAAKRRLVLLHPEMAEGYRHQKIYLNKFFKQSSALPRA